MMKFTRYILFAILFAGSFSLISCEQPATTADTEMDHEHDEYGESVKDGHKHADHHDKNMTHMQDEMLQQWPEKSRTAVMEMKEKYGEPTGMTPTMVVWDNSGPFLRTIVYKEPILHKFPMEHMDYVEQFVNYGVDPKWYDELGMYDGSVMVDRTKGELSARCDKEPMNLLALNLAHDIITGKRTVEDARMFYGKTAMAFKNGDKSSEYVTGLMFDKMNNTADPGQPLDM